MNDKIQTAAVSLSSHEETSSVNQTVYFNAGCLHFAQKPARRTAVVWHSPGMAYIAENDLTAPATAWNDRVKGRASRAHPQVDRAAYFAFSRDLPFLSQPLEWISFTSHFKPEIHPQKKRKIKSFTRNLCWYSNKSQQWVLWSKHTGLMLCNVSVRWSVYTHASSVPMKNHKHTFLQ